MRLIHLLAAGFLASPTIVLAQGMYGDQPSAPPAAGGGSYGAGASSSSAPAASASAPVTTGLPVKDKNGTTIGSVADVKTDPSGKKVATIKMGADSFAVDTSALAVDNGAAVINATQAEIKNMMPKSK
jgi:hypothetical protein